MRIETQSDPEETEHEKRIRIAKNQGLTLKSEYEESSKEQSDRLLFFSDRLRKESDIRNKKENDLTWYQKIQRREIDKKTREHELGQLRKAIFRTFDNWEIKQEIETVEYEQKENLILN